MAIISNSHRKSMILKKKNINSVCISNLKYDFQKEFIFETFEKFGVILNFSFNIILAELVKFYFWYIQFFSCFHNFYLLYNI